MQAGMMNWVMWAKGSALNSVYWMGGLQFHQSEGRG
jgi:hypothetical protein